MGRRDSRGFTLVELLVVIAIIGALVGLLLPAVQAAREAARRIQCANNLHQIGLALHQYHDAVHRFPPSVVYPNRVMWTAQILPHLEQEPLYRSINFSLPFDDGALPNGKACSTYLNVFRCPSSNSPEHVTVQGVEDRVPSNYLAIGSGTATRDWGPENTNIGRLNQDGTMFINSNHNMASLLDGTSNTLLVGECLFDSRVLGADGSGTGQLIDHWYIGTADIRDISLRWFHETSECTASTGVAMNNFEDPTIQVDEKELCLASRHTGGVQAVFGDGHASFLNSAIDRAVYSALGTRAGNEVVSPIDQ